MIYQRGFLVWHQPMAGWFHLVSLRCLISFPEMLMRIVASDQNRERSTVVGRACINIFRDDYVRPATQIELCNLAGEQNGAKLFQQWLEVRIFEEEKQLLLDAGSLERHCTIMTGMALVVSPAILCLKVQRPPVTSFHTLGLQINEHVLGKNRSALKASA